MKSEKFLRSQKILRLATIDGTGVPHIVPVWYMYLNDKFYVGTNTRTRKARNIGKNPKVSFCVDVGIRSPDIIGVMGTGRAKLILKKKLVGSFVKKILLRYFKNMKNKSAQQLFDQTDCIIQITLVLAPGSYCRRRLIPPFTVRSRTSGPPPPSTASTSLPGPNPTRRTGR